MFNDLKYALRVLSKQPGFTLTAIVTLALGIGANTAIFSVVNAVLLQPLPFPQADRIMAVSEGDKTTPDTNPFSLSLPDYLDWRHDNTVFEHLALSRTDAVNLSDVPGRNPEQINGTYVTANFFKVFSLGTQLGRTFDESEDAPNAPLVAVISDRLWSRVFQRDASVIGRVSTFQGRRATIIGVLRPGMVWPEETDVWFSLMRRSTIPAWQQRVVHPLLFAWGRLKAGVTLDQAQAEMKGIAARLEKQFPASNMDATAVVSPLLESMVGKYRTNLAFLLFAVALVLLVACANLANLFAARSATRSREFAVRAAVGARRSQIVRQLLVESLVIATIGGSAGLLLAFWGRDLIGLLEPSSLSRFHDIQFDRRVLGFTALASALTTILFGLWPAWQASRADVQLALKSGGHGSSDTPALRRTRDLLVIVDVALTLVLLSSAALVLKSFAHMQAVSLGFDPQRLTTAKLDLPYVNYSDQKTLENFCENLTSKVAALPGVTHVALAANPPLQQSWQEPFIREDAPPVIPGQEPGAETVTISGDYFGAMAAPLLRGRTFSSRDDKSAPLVVIIDQTLAEKYFPGEDPVGKRLITDAGDTDGVSMRPFEIIGVAPRMKFHGADTTRKFPVIYFSEAQVGRTSLVLFIRGSLATSSFESSLREIVTSLDSRQPVHDVRSMSSLVEETWSTQRLLSSLLSIFAGLSLLLATVGLYGVLSYNAARRSREFGLRFALGARRADIRALIFGHGLRLLAAGSVFGLAAAFAASRILRSVLFEISPTEPLSYFGVAAVLAGATVIACWIPAAKACRIDPASALRSD